MSSQPECFSQTTCKPSNRLLTIRILYKNRSAAVVKGTFNLRGKPISIYIQIPDTIIIVFYYTIFLERNYNMIFTSNTMNLNIKDALAYLSFKALDSLPYIKHAFSTRLGGVSRGEFNSMNMSFNRGDDAENVTENYKRLCAAVGIEFESLVASAQDHHTFVRRVTSSEKGIGIYKPRDLESVDALITNEKGVTLVTYFADCTPILLVDTKKLAVGAAHAGWRGTVGRIGEKTVERMTEEFGSNPNDIVAAIGPTINKCCYEVDEPVALKFKELEGLDTEKFVTPKEGGKYMIDLAETNRQILMSAGVPDKNITLSDVCTRCNSDLVWSHRATGGKRGGMCALIEIV